MRSTAGRRACSYVRSHASALKLLNDL